MKPVRHWDWRNGLMSVPDRRDIDPTVGVITATTTTRQELMAGRWQNQPLVCLMEDPKSGPAHGTNPTRPAPLDITLGEIRQPGF